MTLSTATVGPDQTARDDLTAALVARLADAQPSALVAHALLIPAVVLFLWGGAPTPLVAGWAIALVLSLVIRAVGLRLVGTGDRDPLADRLRMRLLITGSGLAWGVGAAVLMPDLAGQQWALLLVVLSGFVAIAAATLEADPLAYRLFAGCVLAPLPPAILVSGWDRAHLFAVFLVVFFATFVVALNGRLHRGLVKHLNAGIRLAQSEGRIRREHAFLDALFGGAPIAIAVVGPDGRLRGVNPQFERLFGYTNAETMGQAINDLIVPAGAGTGARELDEQVKGGRAVAVEVERRRKDGRLIPVRLSARNIEGAGDGTTFAVYEDITDSRRAADALVAARDAAERAAKTQAAFLANMSHEIRTPMNAILGLTELVLDTDLAAEQRRQMQLVHGAAEGLLTILNDILDFSKIEGEHVALERIPFDLHGLVHANVRLLAVKAAERRLELMCDVAHDVPRMVRGDPGRLRQVLTNLVGNALKFTHEGEVAVTVAAERGAGGDPLIAFAVRDTGIGIPAEKLGTLFHAFSQADVSTTRKYGGTGLGLAISQRLVRLMGGEITVHSAPGTGSEFRFAIPLPVESDAGSVPGPRPGLAGVSALVVDDNATNRRIVRDMLRGADVATDEAQHAEAALTAMRHARARGAPYGLIIIDGQMPGKDGFDLAADVIGDSSLAGTRLLMLTSGGARGDGQRCRDLGIRGYLTKPVSRTELLDAAAAVLADAPGTTPTVVTRHSMAEARRALRLLVAEDNPVNQEVAATMLRKRGHHVEVVSNGREAVEAVARRGYDLVLMDIQMPEMDGLAATVAIRALPNRRDQRIVALTAHASGVERERCLAAGMNGYLTKPFKAHDLFAIVEGQETEGVPAPSSEGPPVDLATFRQTMREAGAEEAVGGIVTMFAHSAPQRLDALAGALATEDLSAIAAAAHVFKSAAGTLGARALATLLSHVEQAARDGDLERARSTLPAVRDSVMAVLAYLEAPGAHARPDR